MAPTTVTRGPRPEQAARRADRAPPPDRRGPRPAPPSVEEPPVAPAYEPVTLDDLAAQWWAALEASNAALRAARRTLQPPQLAEHSRHLAAERAEAMRCLEELGRERHEQSRLVHWLGVPAITAPMLGLPVDVAACVFDLDGVLTTSADVHAAAWTETFDRFLVEQAHRHHRPFIAFDPRHDYQDCVAGRPRREGVRVFLASRGITLPEGSPDDPPGDPTVNGLANRKNRLLQQHLARQGVHSLGGSRCYLQAARMARLTRVVVSPSANTEAILERAGLADVVDVRIDGTTLDFESLRPKPAPDMLLAVCRRLGIEPGRAAAFETTTAGISAARTAGVASAVGVERSGEAELLRASDADRVVADLTELLAPA